MKKILIAINVLILLSITSTCSFSLPAPKYLDVPEWKSCVNLIKKGTAEFICLPCKKPAKCPDTSWKNLTGNKLIKLCPK